MFNKQRKCLKDEKLTATKTLIKEVQKFFSNILLNLRKTWNHTRSFTIRAHLYLHVSLLTTCCLQTLPPEGDLPPEALWLDRNEGTALAQTPGSLLLFVISSSAPAAEWAEPQSCRRSSRIRLRCRWCGTRRPRRSFCCEAAQQTTWSWSGPRCRTAETSEGWDTRAKSQLSVALIIIKCLHSYFLYRIKDFLWRRSRLICRII